MSLTTQEPISANNCALLDQAYLNEHRKPIKKMVRKYLEKSRLGQKYFKRSMVAIENAAKQRNGLSCWIIGDCAGYIVTLPIMQWDELCLVVQQFYGFAMREHLSNIEQYAKEAGFKRILFQTLRQRNAVKRWLGQDWQMGPTIFTKRLI